MKITVETIRPATPKYKLTFEVTQEELEVLYQVGNYSSQIASVISRDQKQIKTGIAYDVLMDLYHGVEDTRNGND